MLETIRARWAPIRAKWIKISRDAEAGELGRDAVIVVSLAEGGDIDRAREIGAAIDKAPEDVAELLAEVDRLRVELLRVAGSLAKAEAERDRLRDRLRDRGDVWKARAKKAEAENERLRAVVEAARIHIDGYATPWGKRLGRMQNLRAALDAVTGKGGSDGE